jgi:DNA-binding response OmpR family regulator
MSGDEMISELRRNPEFDGTPILVLSAKADDELRIELLRHGAQDYVIKPFSQEEIKARVKNLVTVKRARDLLKEELATSEQDLEALAQEVSLKKFELQKSLEEARAAREASSSTSGRIHCCCWPRTEDPAHAAKHPAADDGI